MMMLLLVPASDEVAAEYPARSVILGHRRGGAYYVTVIQPLRGESLIDTCRRGERGKTKRVAFDTLRQAAVYDSYQQTIRLDHRAGRLLEQWLRTRIYRNDLEGRDSPAHLRQRARRALMTGRPDQAAEIWSRHGYHGI